LREQYYLAKHANIPLSDSNLIPEWERMMLMSYLASDMKKEKEAYDNT